MLALEDLRDFSSPRRERVSLHFVACEAVAVRDCCDRCGRFGNVLAVDLPWFSGGSDLVVLREPDELAAESPMNESASLSLVVCPAPVSEGSCL